jgi:hypothetical protein
MTFHSLNKLSKMETRAGEVAQMVDCLSSRHEAEFKPQCHQKLRNNKNGSNFFSTLGFELRASHLLGRHSTT